MDKCTSESDIIVLPEYSDVPCSTSTREETLFYHEKYMDTLMEKCIEIAKRCDSLVFVNALCDMGGINTFCLYIAFFTFITLSSLIYKILCVRIDSTISLRKGNENQYEKYSKH